MFRQQITKAVHRNVYNTNPKTRRRARKKYEERTARKGRGIPEGERGEEEKDGQKEQGKRDEDGKGPELVVDPCCGGMRSDGLRMGEGRVSEEERKDRHHLMLACPLTEEEYAIRAESLSQAFREAIANCTDVISDCILDARPPRLGKEEGEEGYRPGQRG